MQYRLLASYATVTYTFFKKGVSKMITNTKIVVEQGKQRIFCMFLQLFSR